MLVSKFLRARTLKFHPKIVTSFRPHGKWGDLLVCLIPVSWCANIISNSNLILRLIEWQAEASLFTVRVRGKQWYWIYKFDLKAVSDILAAPKNIGHDKWFLSTPNSIETADSYFHALQLRAQSNWAQRYWNKELTKNSKIDFFCDFSHDFLAKNCNDSLQNLSAGELLSSFLQTPWLLNFENFCKYLVENYDLENFDLENLENFDSEIFEYFDLESLEEFNLVNFDPVSLGDFDFDSDLESAELDASEFEGEIRNLGEPYISSNDTMFKLTALQSAYRNWYAEQLSSWLESYEYYFGDFLSDVFSDFYESDRYDLTDCDLVIYDLFDPSYYDFEGCEFNNDCTDDCTDEIKNLGEPFVISSFESTLTNTSILDDFSRERFLKSCKVSNDFFRLIKQPITNKSSFFDFSPSLFDVRFADTNNDQMHQVAPQAVNVVLKQKRYTRRKVIYPQISSSHNFSTKMRSNAGLTNFYYLNDTGLDRTATYNFFKKKKIQNDLTSTVTNRRMLRTKKTLVLPAHVNITAITNSYDVIHSWFIPGLGLKLDCVPGRSTHHTFFIDNFGFYYGQCAEVCGRFHHHMPIRICALPYNSFIIWWHNFGLIKFLNIGSNYKLKLSCTQKYVW